MGQEITKQSFMSITMGHLPPPKSKIRAMRKQSRLYGITRPYLLNKADLALVLRLRWEELRRAYPKALKPENSVTYLALHFRANHEFS